MKQRAEAKSLTADASSGLLTAENLVNMFEASEDASLDARNLSERDRDYYDGKQLTDTEIKALEDRHQPPIIVNRIKRKIDFLRGYEQSQRVDPRALPRTPRHEADAEGAEQALRYVSDQQDFDQKRSAAWDNLLIEGMAGYRVSVRDGYDGVEVTIDRIPWDRMFYDPHSSERDFSDAAYLGVVRWADLDEAIREYPDSADMLEANIKSASISDTYDDKPKYKIWADRVRRRVRICQIWVKRADQWYWAEFTKGGILKSGASPFVTDKGESDCELIFGSAYVNRDNERYGIVREMIGPQDEINKRRSKSLHLLNTAQVMAEDGAVPDVQKARKEIAKPDGWIRLNPGGIEKMRVETRLDLANGHMELLQEAKNEIDMMAGNIALQGNALQKTAASGKAIIASQQGGAMEIAPLMDALRHMDIRVYRAIWARIRQFWTKDKWLPVTDDERNVKWLGINVDPMQAQMFAMQSPQMSEKIAGIVGNVAELDCDIIIDDAPDGLTPQLEQFQSLVELKKMDAMNELPFRAILTAMPNLKNKEAVLAAMDQAKQGPDPQAALQAQQAQFEAMMQAEQAKLQQTLQAKAAESELALSVKEREAALNMGVKEQEAQLDLIKRQAEIEMQANAKAAEQEIARRQAEADVARAERQNAVEAAAGEEDDTEEEAPQIDTTAIIAELMAQNQQVMTSAAQAMTQALAQLNQPKQIQIVRDRAGNIIGGQSVVAENRA